MIKRMQQIKETINIPNNALQGKIPHFSVVEILQMLHISKKSGTVKFANEHKKGKIGFVDGKLVWAELDQITGEDAVKEIACWKDGYFIFEKDLIDPIRNIHTSSMQLILDCCQILDEKNDRQ